MDLSRACLGMLSPDTGPHWTCVLGLGQNQEEERGPKSQPFGRRALPLRPGMLTASRFLLFVGKSFREQQCEKYNAYNYTDMDGTLLQWVPKYAGVSPRDRCKLFCRARGRSEFKVFEAKVRILPELRTRGEGGRPPASPRGAPGPLLPPASLLQVIDGTLCGPETLAICVRGQCVKAGCDHVVDSPRKLDKCGVCGGKGNSCRKVSGSLNPSR